MGMKQTFRGEVVTKYLEKYANKPTNWIARLVKKDHPKLFKDVQNVRRVINYYRGRDGAANRVQVTKQPQYKKFVLPEPTKENPFSMPDPDILEYQPYIIPSSLKRGLLLYDIHLPYHDQGALALAIKAGQDFGADFVGLGGDILDCYMVSKFCKDPNKRNLKGEVEYGRHFLEALRTAFPKASMFFKEGNHEERLTTYLKSNAPQLLGLEEFQLKVLLDLYKYGVDWVGDKRKIYCGHLNILHGHEFARGGNPINPARSTYLKSMDNVIVGHWHKTSEHSGYRMRDEIVTCWSAGGLCQRAQEYMPINDWTQGFVLVEKEEDGKFRLQNKRIFEGEVL